MNTGPAQRTQNTTLEYNLQALAQSQPRVAEQIERIDSSTAQAATGRDGSPTYRITVDGRSTWLGHSSMPTLSSPALLAEFTPGSGNVLLPSIGHGGEAVELLTRMGRQQAVFTWDLDALVPALALRRYDFADAILTGRLVIAIGQNLLAALTACFVDYPTHLPPSKIFSAPYLQPADIHRLQTQAESVAAEQNRRLTIRLAEFASASETRSGPAAGAPQAACPSAQVVAAVRRRAPLTQQRHARSSERHYRVLILSMMIDPHSSEIAAGLVCAAGELGIPCTAHTPDRPSNVHLASAAQCIKRCDPTHVILLDQVQGEWGGLLDTIPHCASWCLSPRAIRPELMRNLSARDCIFAVSTELVEQLKSARDPYPPIELLGPAADGSIFRTLELDSAERDYFGSDVAIVLDASEITAEAIGLKWESHRQLFGEMVGSLRAAPRRLTAAQTDDLLKQASLQTQIALDSVDIRSELCRMMQALIEPTLAALHLVPLLVKRGLSVSLWGSGWEEHDASRKAKVLPRPTSQDRNKIYNAAHIILHLRNDEQHDLQLLEAVAAGGRIIFRQFDPPSEPAQVVSESVQSKLPSFTSSEEGLNLVSKLGRTARLTSTQPQAAQLVVRSNHLLSSRLAQLLGPFLSTDGRNC